MPFHGPTETCPLHQSKVASSSTAWRRSKISSSGAELLATPTASAGSYLKIDHCIKFSITELLWRAVVHLIQCPTLALHCPIEVYSVVLLA